MSMIRTHKRENPFVQLDKGFIGGNQLSLKATGLLTYFLSKPDDWQIYMKDVQNQFKDGETSIRSAMKELIEAYGLVAQLPAGCGGRSAQLPDAAGDVGLDVV